MLLTIKLAFLILAEEGKLTKDGREGLYTNLQSGHATAPGVWILKMWGWEGAIDRTHTSSDILLKNDQISTLINLCIYS